MIQDDFGEGLTIESEGDASIREERTHPVTEGGGKAKKSEDMNKAADVKVVKEPLDVKEEQASNPATFDTHLDCVCHAQDGI